MRHQRRGEQAFALLGVGCDEAPALLGQMDIALLKHREVQQLQGLPQWQQFVGLILQSCRERRQVGVAVVRLPSQCLHQPRHLVGPDTQQWRGDAHHRRRSNRARHRAAGHQSVNIVHQLPKRRIKPIARMRERHAQLACHAPRARREHQDAVAHQNRFLNVVRHH